MIFRPATKERIARMDYAQATASLHDALSRGSKTALVTARRIADAEILEPDFAHFIARDAAKAHTMKKDRAAGTLAAPIARIRAQRVYDFRSEMDARLHELHEAERSSV